MQNDMPTLVESLAGGELPKGTRANFPYVETGQWGVVTGEILLHINEALRPLTALVTRDPTNHFVSEQAFEFFPVAVKAARESQGCDPSHLAAAEQALTNLLSDRKKDSALGERRCCTIVGCIRAGISLEPEHVIKALRDLRFHHHWKLMVALWDFDSPRNFTGVSIFMLMHMFNPSGEETYSTHHAAEFCYGRPQTIRELVKIAGQVPQDAEIYLPGGKCANNFIGNFSTLQEAALMALTRLAARVTNYNGPSKQESETALRESAGLIAQTLNRAGTAGQAIKYFAAIERPGIEALLESVRDGWQADYSVTSTALAGIPGFESVAFRLLNDPNVWVVGVVIGAMRRNAKLAKKPDGLAKTFKRVLLDRPGVYNYPKEQAALGLLHSSRWLHPSIDASTRAVALEILAEAARRDINSKEVVELLK